MSTTASRRNRGIGRFYNNVRVRGGSRTTVATLLLRCQASGRGGST